MPHDFAQERLVEFADTDMAGIVHFSNFFRYMEATEHAFFRSLGFTLHHRTDGVMHGWARVHAECDYERPLHYQDRVHVHLTVVGKSANTLSYSFEFKRNDQPEVVARGALKVVHVTKEPDGDRIRACPIPAEIADSIQVAPTARNTDHAR